MGIISKTYKDNYENFITLPVIFRFIKENKIDYDLGKTNRASLLEAIENYGLKSQENRENVLSWVDNIVKEGIRDIHIHKISVPDDISDMLSDCELCEEFLEESSCLKKHLCENTYDDHFVLVNACRDDISTGRRIVFFYCKRVITLSSKDNVMRAIDYPITIEYYLDSSWLVISTKPRSKIYKYTEKQWNLENLELTNNDKLVLEAKKNVIKLLHAVETNATESDNYIKSRIFELIDKYTHTPKVIQDLIDSHQEDIHNLCGFIKEACAANGSQEKDIIGDLNNLMEKYMSINWKNSDIFTKDRVAYPIKISATDEDLSKVEQTSALSEPLQKKAIFFDNKKMLYKNKKCDGVVMKWKKQKSDDYFTVIISSNRSGRHIIKFREYTSQEDMHNVLFSIIES